MNADTPAQSPEDEVVEKIAAGSIVLPKWFLWACGTFLPLAVLWGAHITNTIHNLSTEVAVIKTELGRQNEMRVQLAALEKQFRDHMADPRIHHAGIETINRRVDRVEARLDRMEKLKAMASAIHPMLGNAIYLLWARYLL